MVQFSPKHEQNKVEDIADNLKVKLTILILQVSRDMVMGAKASVSQAQQGDILQAERSQVSMSVHSPGVASYYGRRSEGQGEAQES